MVKKGICPRCKEKMWATSKRCRKCFSKSRFSGVGKILRERNRYALKSGKIIVDYID